MDEAKNTTSILSTLPIEARRGLLRIKTLELQRRKLFAEADSIIRTCAFGQAPPVYHRTMDKVYDIAQKQAVIWNDIRSFIIPATGDTLWQFALKHDMDVGYYGDEHYLKLNPFIFIFHMEQLREAHYAVGT